MAVEIYSLRTGASESMVLNGNVTGFRVSNNLVHDCNNIGIDFIGYEESNRIRRWIRLGTECARATRCGISTRPSILLMAVILRRVVEIDLRAAFMWMGAPKSSSNAIYVFRCNFGIELASEAASGFTDFITVSNLVHHNHIAGLIMGGYDRLRGQTRNCDVSRSTFIKTIPRSHGPGRSRCSFM